MNAGLLALALALPLALGASALLALGARPGRDVLGFLGLVFPVGALLTGLFLFAWMHVGVSLSGWGLPVALGGLALALGVQGVRSRAAPSRPTPAPVASRLPAEFLFWFVLLVALSDVTFVALDHLYEPIARGDSATIWTMRAKMLFDHGAIDASLPDTLSRSLGARHLDYPLFNPLLQVWMMATAGAEFEGAVRWPTNLWYVSTVLCLFSATRRRCGPLLGAGIAWLYVSLPVLSIITIGTMMDLPVTLAFLGLIDRVLRIFEDPQSPDPNLALACVWATILVWTKNEGTMLLGAALVGGLFGLPWKQFLRRPRWRELVMLALPAAVFLAQWSFNQRFGFQNDLLSGGEGQDTRGFFVRLFQDLPRKAGGIASFFWEICTNFNRSRYLFLLFVAACLLGGRAAWRSPNRFAAIAIATAFAGYFLAYAVSFHGLQWHLGTSAGRTTGHLMGAIAVFLATVVSHREYSEKTT